MYLVKIIQKSQLCKIMTFATCAMLIEMFCSVCSDKDFRYLQDMQGFQSHPSPAEKEQCQLQDHIRHGHGRPRPFHMQHLATLSSSHVVAYFRCNRCYQVFGNM